jgi:hypothetical protein
MRKLSGLLLAATLVLSASAMAQEEPRSSPWAQWFQWLFGLPADESPVTVAHPRALGLAAADQAREGRLQQNWLNRQFAEDKARFKRQIQVENDRQIAVAIANKAPAPPFRETRENTGQGANPAPAAIVIMEAPPGASTPPPRRAPTPAATPPGGPGQRAAEAAEAIASRVGEAVFGPAAARPMPAGLFVLALVGMFLAPAAGAALVLIGFAHLRGHSFFSGSVITVLGGLFIWGTIALATRINPDLLSADQSEQPWEAEASGNISPMDALRPETFWPVQ